MHATESCGRNNVDLIIDPLDAGKPSQDRLQHLLEIKGGQSAHQHQPAFSAVDVDRIAAAAEMIVLAQPLMGLGNDSMVHNFLLMMGGNSQGHNILTRHGWVLQYEPPFAG